MTSNGHELILKEEVFAIVGGAMEVSNELGAGYLEAVYQEALALEFEARKIPFAPHPAVQIAYKGQILSKAYYPDFLCFDQVIVEIKALKELTNIEQAQILNYLKATGKSVGVLINFGSTKLEWQRFVYTQSKTRVRNGE